VRRLFHLITNPFDETSIDLDPSLQKLFMENHILLNTSPSTNSNEK